MIDIEKLINAYKQFIKNYDVKDRKIALKVGHMLRVKNISRDLAQRLNLPTEDVYLAESIGLLHDFGRFEQIKRYNTFSDKDSINHGELGVKILFEEGLIRDFIDADEYYGIIRKSILNHNRTIIEKGLSERELLFAKIIRDADKLDILYTVTKADPKRAYQSEDFPKERFTDEVYEEFVTLNTVDYSKFRTPADVLLATFWYVFDLNYTYSINLVKEKGYLEQIYRRFTFEDSKTQMQFGRIYQITKEKAERGLTKTSGHSGPVLFG